MPRQFLVRWAGSKAVLLDRMSRNDFCHNFGFKDVFKPKFPRPTSIVNLHA